MEKYTIKDCTAQMLIDIRCAYNKEKRTSDKEIAKKLGITPASFSRLYTKLTMPKIMTWQKIIKLHTQCIGIQRNTELLKRINDG